MNFEEFENALSQLDGDEDLEARITLNPNDLLIPLHRVLNECSNAVCFGIAVFDQVQELPDLIHSEDNFHMHRPAHGTRSLEDNKTLFRNWIIKKGVEDLVKAITLFLIDVLDTIQMAEKINTGGKLSLGEFRKTLFARDPKLSKLHLPALFDRLRPYLKEPLSLEKEILSINKIRNCLVHRNGRVSSGEVNSETGTLTLEWIYYKAIYKTSDKTEFITEPVLLAGPGELNLIQERKSVSFKENQLIALNFQQFNELIMTCNVFGAEVITKLSLSKVSESC